MILVASNFALLLLPLFGVTAMRLYESALIRQTENALISQAAFVSAALRERLATAEGIQRIARLETDRWRPRFADLDLSRDVIAPIPRPPVLTDDTPDPRLMRHATALQTILLDAQDTTLSAMRIVDPSGIIAISTGEDQGRNLAHWDLFKAAMDGRRYSQMKRREPPSPAPPLSSISRTSRIRVYYTEPVWLAGELRATVMLWRTPPNISQTLWGKRYELGIALWLALLALTGLTGVVLLALRNPLKQLETLADRTARGDFALAQPLTHPRTREVANLSRSIQVMATTLNERSEYLRDLAARISHEFKSPITSISGAAELLTDEAETMPPAMRTRFIANIHSDADRLNRLVSRLMELAQADFKASELSMQEPLSTIIEELKLRYGDAPITWRISAETASRQLPGEEVQSILINLIDNALTYGALPKDVVVDIQSELDATRFDVSNHGNEISEDLASKMFSPFFTTARDNGGTGLGLSVAGAMARALGGEIQLIPSDDRTLLRVVLKP